LKRVLEELLSATNTWAKRNQINNPWADVKHNLPKVSNSDRSKKAWSSQEVEEILRRMKEVYPAWYSYVAFLAWTGCRPEEAIALEWEDICLKSGSVSISKVFTHGSLVNRTKTGSGRLINVGGKVRDMLRSCYSTHEKIVFPAPKGGYINQNNFNRRKFKPVVQSLKDQGKVSKVLPTYNLRNTFITLLLGKGLNLATVAKMAGTSERMILAHYWGADNSIVIPDI